MTSEPAPHQSTSADSGADKGLGIGAIICGGLGLCVPGLALIGLILGVIGLVVARPGGKSLPGVGTGVSGGALVLNIVLLVAVLIPAIGAAGAATDMVHEQQQLSKIGRAYMSYAADRNSMFPDHAADIEIYLSDGEDIFTAPPAKPGDINLTKTEGKPTRPYTYGSFVFLPLAGRSMDSIRHPSEVMIAYSAEQRGPDGRFVSTVFMDGHVAMMDEAEFDQALAKTHQELGITD